MAPQKTFPEGDVPVRQVNNILQNLRGEHFRHSRNVRGRLVSSDSIASYAHNQPTLPINLIYPSQPPAVRSSRVAGPSPPRSWRATATSTSSSQLPKDSIDSRDINDIDTSSSAWREAALSLVFSPDLTSPPSSTDSFRGYIYPNSSTVPHLTLLCLQLILATCPGSDIADVAPYIPPHLRRALLRYTAIHAPLSKTELDALCDGASHVDGELIIVGPRTSLRGNMLKKKERGSNTKEKDADTLECSDSVSAVTDSWDAMQIHDDEPTAFLSLAVLSSPVSAIAFQAFPPTITHLALVNIPQRIPLQRLPTICPLLVLLDLSYNSWLSRTVTPERGGILEEVGWGKLRRLEVLGLRGCLVTAKVFIELNRGRWTDVRVIQ